MLLFASYADLFFAVAISTGRKIGLGGVRRVLTFPSGGLLWRKIELDLLVGLGGCGCRGVGLAVRRGEDAEGDGDAGLKVQGDDLSGARVSLLLDLSIGTKGRQEE
jgi:hypothetical protein